MEINDFIQQFLKLKEKELEQKVWEIWLVKYPHMDKNNFVSYEEMLNSAKQQEVKEVDNVEIQIPINGVYVDQIFF